MLRHTWESLAKVLLLSGDPHRALIGMTDASHDAAFGDHRYRTKTIFLSPEQGRDYNVPTGLETTIGT